MIDTHQLFADLEYIISGWYDGDPLSMEDVQEMAAEIHGYVLETYGPPF